MTEREKYLLICLMEEAAEIQQACSRSLRFGLDSSHPNGEKTLGKEITTEIADLLGVVSLLVDNKTIESPHDISLIEKKKIKVTNHLIEKGI